MNQICKQCGQRPVEYDRVCYGFPTCHQCLPPPEPLKLVETRQQLKDELGQLRAELDQANRERIGGQDRISWLIGELGKWRHKFIRLSKAANARVNELKSELDQAKRELSDCRFLGDAVELRSELDQAKRDLAACAAGPWQTEPSEEGLYIIGTGESGRDVMLDNWYPGIGWGSWQRPNNFLCAKIRMLEVK